MNLSIAELIEAVLAAALRRKQLIIWPIVFFSALCILAVLFWPRTYVTSALLMLQERQSTTSLSLDGAPTRQGRLNAEEVDTLLKSERVLTGAILDMNIRGEPLTGEAIEGEIRSLRKRISVGVVGSDFIQIELKDSERVGISEKLSIIMTRFFERLLTRGDAMRTAREFALEQRQREVVATKSAIESWIDRAQAAGAKGDFVEDRLKTLRNRKADLQNKLAAGADALLPGRPNLATIEQDLHDELRMSTRSSSADALAENSSRVRDLKALADDAAAYRAVENDISQVLNTKAQGLALSLKELPATVETKQLMREWSVLESRHIEAVNQYSAHMERARKGAGPALTPFGLIAPDSIRIIDEPRDPELPTTSLLKILVACLGAGVALGAGLAALAEQLDDRIYEPRRLAALTGVDTVFRLPELKPDAVTEADMDERPPRRGRLAIVSLA